jgi:UDP-glucose 6-dehydrogenase
MEGKGPDYGEPEIGALLGRHTPLATTSIALGLQGSSASFIYVPTPTEDGGREFDPSIVAKVVQDIAIYTFDETLGLPAPYPIVICSTLSLGQVRSIWEQCALAAGRIRLYYAPALVALGSVMEGFRHPSLQILGVPDQIEDDPIVELYNRLYGNAIVKPMSWEQGELTKIGINCWLSAKPTFAIQYARLCSHAGVHPGPVLDAMRQDPRMGRSFSRYGTIPGGHCLPRDVDCLMAVMERVWVGGDEALRAPRLERERELEAMLRAAQSVSARTVGIVGLS